MNFFLTRAEEKHKIDTSKYLNYFIKGGSEMSLWNFVQDQLLGMAWLNDLIGRGLSKVGVDTTSPMGGVCTFFSMM